MGNPFLYHDLDDIYYLYCFCDGLDKQSNYMIYYAMCHVHDFLAVLKGYMHYTHLTH